MKKTPQKIDLVYLWVDGSDPVWLKKRDAFLGIVGDNRPETCKGRFANNDELKYSLRSVEEYAPWIQNIFIVTDNQTPAWLETTNPKIKIIDHKDILPEIALPCFNSSVIEYFLYNISGLSEHFLLSNDDMFFTATVTPDFFFKEDGFPIVRLKKYPFENLIYQLRRFLIGHKPGQYRQMIADSAKLVRTKFGKNYSALPHHNIDAYKKSDYQQAVENIFKPEVEKSLHSHLRQFGDFQRSAISYYALAIGHGHLRYVDNYEAQRISAHKTDFMKAFLRFNPKLLCLNDGQHTTDEDRARIKPFLELLFQKKSSFEK